MYIIFGVKNLRDNVCDASFLLSRPYIYSIESEEIPPVRITFTLNNLTELTDGLRLSQHLINVGTFL